MTNNISSFKDLEVWQRARRLAKGIYIATNEFPDSQRFILTAQIQRSAISVPSNIAEGQTRKATKDYIRFLNIALGSLAELETQLLIASDLGYIKDTNLEQLTNECHIIGRMLNKLVSSLERNLATNTPKPKARTLEPA